MAKRESQPSEAFHMSTRKRAKTAYEPAETSTPAGGDVNDQASNSSQNFSLPSVPSQESFPEGFEEIARLDTTHQGRSTRKRSRDEVADPEQVLDKQQISGPDEVENTVRVLRKRKVPSNNGGANPDHVPKKRKTSGQAEAGRDEVADSEQVLKQQIISGQTEVDQDGVSDPKQDPQSQAVVGQGDGVAYPEQVLNNQKFSGQTDLIIPTSPTQPYKEFDSEFRHQWSSRRYWPNLHKDRGRGERRAPVYYAADGTTRRVAKFRDDFEKASRTQSNKEQKEAQAQAKADKLEAEEANKAAHAEKLEIIKALKAIDAAAAEAASADLSSDTADSTEQADSIVDAADVAEQAVTTGQAVTTEQANNATDATADVDEADHDADAVDAGETESHESPREGTPQKKSTRGGKAARGKGKNSRVGRGGGRGKGKRAGDESPEPPQRQRNLTPETEDVVKKLRARQAELKRFFHIVGSQQIELLDMMATRDTQKLLKKPKAHKTVPEYDAVVDELKTRMEDTQQGVRDEYQFKVQYEKDILKKRKEVQERQFDQRCQQLKAEHLHGAQGDIFLLKKAHAADMDDTRTEDGSDLDFFPRYHEMPEPDARVRGYITTIFDEKPFREALESYDVQDVIDEEVLGPLRKELEEQNRKHREEVKARFLQDHKSLKELSDECIKQLQQVNGYLIPRPLEPSELSAFSLSALADLAEWIATTHPQKTYQYVPLAPCDTFPREALEFGPLPGIGRRLAPALGHVQPPLAPPQPGPAPVRNPRRRRKSPVAASPLRPQLNLLTSVNGSNHHSISSVPTTPVPVLPAPVVSSGPGQPIAPAPPRPIASTAPAQPATFRHSTYSIPPGSRAIPSPSPRSGAPPQQYVFQPPQQTQVHQPGAGAWAVPAGPRPPRLPVRLVLGQ